MLIHPAAKINELNKAHFRNFANAAGDNLPFHNGAVYTEDRFTLWSDHYEKDIFIGLCIPDWWELEVILEIYEHYELTS